MAPNRSDDNEFAEFVATAEPRLRRALFPVGGVATADAVADALAYAWEHWDRVQAMDNPIGYLYRVGRSRLRPRKTPVLPPVDTARIPDVEPGSGAGPGRGCRSASGWRWCWCTASAGPTRRSPTSGRSRCRPSATTSPAGSSASATTLEVNVR